MHMNQPNKETKIGELGRSKLNVIMDFGVAMKRHMELLELKRLHCSVVDFLMGGSGGWSSQKVKEFTILH